MVLINGLQLTGAQIKEKMRPEVLIPDTQRMTTSTNELGVAAPTNGENVALRPKIRKSRNNTYEGSGLEMLTHKDNGQMKKLLIVVKVII